MYAESYQGHDADFSKRRFAYRVVTTWLSSVNMWKLPSPYKSSQPFLLAANLTFHGSSHTGLGRVTVEIAIMISHHNHSNGTKKGSMENRTRKRTREKVTGGNIDQ
jgi:hypothetical protein